MKAAWVLLVPLLLAACGDDGWKSTVADTRLGALSIDRSPEPTRPMNELEAAVADETSACAGSTCGRPEIEYCVCSDEPCASCVQVHRGALGEYWPGSKRISIDPAAKGYAGIFQHEMVHYLLECDENDLDAEHKSPLFEICAPPGLIGDH